MSESNNVKFVEAGGKWLWKRYNAEGSVISRSQLFNTEREAREDYDVRAGKTPVSSTDTEQSQDAAPDAGPVGGVTTASVESNTVGNAASEGEVSAGTVAP